MTIDFLGSPDRGTGGLLGWQIFFSCSDYYIKNKTHGDQRKLMNIWMKLRRLII